MKKVYQYLRNYSSDIEEINKLLVSTFIDVNKLEVYRNRQIKTLNVLTKESKHLVDFSNLIKELHGEFSIELLIELFEFVISPIDKSVNGAVYTPKHIRAYIIEYALSHYPESEWKYLTYADISCGCGGFFISLAERIRKSTDITLAELYPLFYGVDIESYSIERTKILLNLYAILNGEDIPEMRFNLWQGNSLSFDWRHLDCFQDKVPGFDVVVGNPPYVTSSRISVETKKLIAKWEVAYSGKIDLYIPFTQIAIEVLKPQGVLGYITVNSFYRSLNGRALRQYLSNFSYSLCIIDFRGEQIFKGRSTYTCLLLLQKEKGNLRYTRSRSNSLSLLSPKDFTVFSYSGLNNYQGWELHMPQSADVINRIQSTGIPLGDYCSIRNGFATLKNKVYILDYIGSDDKYYYAQVGDRSIFKIEKEICRDVIKPNTLHKEEDIPKQIEKMIFPYYKRGGKTIVMSESYLSEHYPHAYSYLLVFKDSLAQRDKGNRQYEEWFAFGRTQALEIQGNKLFFPYLSDKPRFVLSNKSDLLFYNGYAIVSEDIRKLQILQRILSSSIFWFYIVHTSKPYGNGFFALAKNYIKNFGVPLLTQEEEEFLLEEASLDKINIFLKTIYQLDNLNLTIDNTFAKATTS